MKRGKFRNAIFAVTYKIENEKIIYLLLKRKLHWKGWEFPKGGIKFLELKKQTVKREIKEETNLKIISIKKFNIKGKYLYQKKLKDRPNFVGQKYYLYVVKVKNGEIKFDKIEHSNYEWMDFNKAIKILTWDNQKQCLKKVNDYLKNAKKN